MKNPKFDDTEFVQKWFNIINNVETKQDLNVMKYLIKLKRKALKKGLELKYDDLWQ